MVYQRFIIIVLLASFSLIYAVDCGCDTKNSLADWVNCFEDGSGTEDDPFIIATPEQFLLLNQDCYELKSASFKLAYSIDFQQWAGLINYADVDSLGRPYIKPIPAFSGTFDGNGNTISNFALKNTSDYVSNNSLGLFCELFGASIYDLEISNASVEVDNPEGVSYLDEVNAIWAGILCGSASATLSGINIVNSEIDYQNNREGTPFNVGGIGALITQSKITGCSVDVIMNVYAKDVQLYDNDGFVGLMAGRIEESSVGQDTDGQMDCFVSGQLTVTIDDCSQPVGGIGIAFGGFEYSTADCLIVGSQDQRVQAEILFSNVHSYFAIGGFAGHFAFNEIPNEKDDALVNGCAVYADINYHQDAPSAAYKEYATVSIGGFLGVTYTGSSDSVRCTNDCISYSNIYVTGHASSISVGGFVGTHAEGTISESQWLGETIDLSGIQDDSMPIQFAVGGFAGSLMHNGTTESDTLPVLTGCSVDYTKDPNEALQLDSYLFGDMTIDDYDYDLNNYNTADKYNHKILAFKESYLDDSDMLDANIGVGGFIGISKGIIDDSEARSIWIEGPVGTGGFAGQMYDPQGAEIARFVDCISSDIHIKALGRCVGGFIGHARGSIDYSYDGFTSTAPDDEYVILECTATNIYDIKTVELYGNTGNAIGGFAGSFEKIFLKKCCTVACLGIEERLKGDSLGGVVGSATQSSLDQCAAIGVLLCDETGDIGGIAGTLNETNLYRSACYSTVYTGPNTAYVGGLAGTAVDCYISSSMVMCSLTPHEDCDYFGGLCGQIYGDSTLINSYVSGNIQMISTKEEILAGLDVVKDIISEFLPSSIDCIALDILDAVGFTKDVIDFVDIATASGVRGKVGAVCGYIDTDTVSVDATVHWDNSTISQSYFADNVTKLYSDRGLSAEQIIRNWSSKYCNLQDAEAYWYNSTSASSKFVYPVPFWLYSFSENFDGLFDPDGSNENPYDFTGQPTNPYDEDNYNYDPNSTYVLTTDTTLALTFPGIGTEDAPFTGTFDGQGFTLYISDIDYSENGTIAGSLINFADNATIKNVNVVLLETNLNEYEFATFGFIVGQANGSTVIENCSVTSAEDVTWVNAPELCLSLGLIAGKIMGNTSIIDCNVGDVSMAYGSISMAGMAALAYDNSMIVDCHAESLLNCQWPYTTAGMALDCFDEVQVIGCSQTDSTTLVCNLYGNASIVESSSECTAINSTLQMEQLQYYGGIVCEMFENSSVTNCKVLDPLMIGLYSGGVVGGAHDNASIEGCIMQTKRDFLLKKSPLGCGGIVGKTGQNTLVSKCITKEQYQSGYCNGGIVGINEGTIADSLVYDFKCNHADGAFSNGNVAGMHNGGMVFNVVYNNDSDIQPACGTSQGYEILLHSATSGELSQESYYTGIGWSIGTEATWILKRDNALFPILQSHEIASGDCAGDYFVDMIDFAHLASKYPDLDESFDLNGSGQVDEADLMIFMKNWLAY